MTPQPEGQICRPSYHLPPSTLLCYSWEHMLKMNTCLSQYLKTRTLSPEMGPRLPQCLFSSSVRILSPRGFALLLSTAGQDVTSNSDNSRNVSLKCHSIVILLCHISKIKTDWLQITKSIEDTWITVWGKELFSELRVFKENSCKETTFKRNFIKFSVWILFPLVKTFYPLMLENSVL